MSEPTATDLLQEAQRLQPEFASRRLEVESQRCLPTDIADQLKAAGFHLMWTPRHCGGLELPPAAGVEIIEELAVGDASVAWVAFITATSGSLLAGLREADGVALYPDPSMMVCGVAAPRGRAQRVAGGFQVSGHWSWGSGIANAGLVGAGCMFFDGDEPMQRSSGAQRTHMVLVPAAEVDILDRWDASGLRGTGSTDFELHDVFVPDEHIVGYLGSYPPRPLYQFPHFSLLAVPIAAVALGIARVAMDDLITLAGGKQPTGSNRSLAERSQTQADVARAAALVQASREWFYAVLGRVWAQTQTGEVSLADRRDLRLATTHAAHCATEAVDLMYHLGGGTSVYRESRLQQCFRDIHVLTQHIMVGPSTVETVGRLILDLPTNTATL